MWWFKTTRVGKKSLNQEVCKHWWDRAGTKNTMVWAIGTGTQPRKVGQGFQQKGRGQSFLSVFMCSRTGLEKTKSTCLGTEDLQQRVVSDAGYPWVTAQSATSPQPGQFSPNSKLLLIWSSEFLSSVYKPPWVDSPFEKSYLLCTKDSLQNSSLNPCSGKHR